MPRSEGRRAVCLALLLLALCGVTDFVFWGGPRTGPTARRAKSVDADVVAKETVSTFSKNAGFNKTEGTQPVAELEKELKKEVEVTPVPPKERKDEAEIKVARAAQKTAETKERVAEKKLRKQAEAAAAKEPAKEVAANEPAKEVEGIDYAAYAKQARQMAAEAAQEAAKPGKESSAARAKELALNLGASGLEAAAESPVLVPAGAAVAGLLLLVSLTASPKPPQTPPVVQKAPAPMVVSVQPTAAGGVSTAPPKAAPAPASAPAPAPAMPPPAAPKSFTKQELPWARNFANSTADTLRYIAQGLPEAEKTVEEELPVAESALEWASSVTADNATEKIEKDVLPAAGRLAGEVLRAGLRAGAVGLDFAAKNLPAAEQALGAAVDKGMPAAQAALRDAATGARTLAREGLQGLPQLPAEVSSNSVVKSLVGAAPDVLSSTAQVLDMTADMAPEVTSVVGSVVSEVTPIAQAGLSVASDVAEGVSNIPPSVVESGVGKLVDSVKGAIPTDVVSNVKQFADQTTAKVLAPKQ
mmetsp:Transcript_19506/g.45339  ORF Transcript_19506/g.45339 Transcript_19506/m.45339 type:complete len:529 (+) Transcript_19506:52-1638(+)